MKKIALFSTFIVLGFGVYSLLNNSSEKAASNKMEKKSIVDNSIKINKEDSIATQPSIFRSNASIPDDYNSQDKEVVVKENHKKVVNKLKEILPKDTKVKVKTLKSFMKDNKQF